MRGTDPTKSKWVCLKYLHICKDCFTFCILFLISEGASEAALLIYYCSFVVLDRIK
jgi:hypothetical protein